jgi:Leucine-rich repeat (LRR) protein
MEVVYIMSFNDLHKLQQLPSTEALILFTCRHCKIAEIDNEAFIDTKNIKLLDLAYNELTSSSLNSDIFRGPYNDDEYSPIMLESLDLSHNRIDSLDKFVFEHTPHLKKLDLSFNELKTIEEGSAIALSNLHNLQVSHLHK